jgi:hypothetical protein
VLTAFLGTYVSRHSDYRGFWLFGFLVASLGELRIDLLATPAGETDSPLGFAVRSAAAKFADQAQKAGLIRRQIREAWLTIQKLPGLATGSINGVPCAGHHVSFSAVAVMENGQRFERRRVVFVAPHNAVIELQSTRAGSQDATADGFSTSS